MFKIQQMIDKPPPLCRRGVVTNRAMKLELAPKIERRLPQRPEQVVFLGTENGSPRTYLPAQELTALTPAIEEQAEQSCLAGLFRGG